MSELDDIAGEFLAECREHLNGIEADLLQMEKDGAALDEERVNRVFRAAHSIKGGAGFFNFNRIRDLAHRTENVLDLIRSKRLVPGAEVINVLLMTFDKLGAMIGDPAFGEETDISGFIDGLEGLAASVLGAEDRPAVSRPIPVVAGGRSACVAVTEFDYDSARQSGKIVYLIECDLLHDVQRKGKNPLDVIRDLIRLGALLGSAFAMERAGTLEDDAGSSLPLEIVYATSAPVEKISEIAGAGSECIWRMERSGVCQRVGEVAAPAQQQREAAHPAPPRRDDAAKSIEDHASKEDRAPVAISSGTADSVRLNVAVLDSLMNLAGELVLCRNQLGEAVSRRDEAGIRAASQGISVVTSEVQQAVMRTRMQPVAHLFQKFTRTVRDTAAKLGKQVRLVIEANDVELDKTIVEGLSDPLSHMVRNAVDHGIEPPAAREAKGKPAEGTVYLRAWHEAGLVVVEVADDGRGLDPDKLAAAALAKGLVTADAVQGMAAEKKLELILLPGFSTAERITDVSGRGVGMDVVKTNLDRLSGKLEIHSAPGEGSSFRIKLPLTLAIIPSLLVSAGEERIAVPLVNVQKLIRLAPGEAAGRIERVGNARVLVTNDGIEPLVELRRSLEIEPDETAAGDGAMNIVLVTGGGFRYGLVVDRLHETIEIVVKPLGQRLKRLREYAGATILGDGCVALILDVAGVASAAGLLTEGRLKTTDASAVTDGESHQLLLVHNSVNEVCALPLHAVERVEKICPEQVEFVGGRRTMQYRGRNLPLVALADCARASELVLDANLIVVVLAMSGRSIGLLASRPVDVIEAELDIDGSTLRQPGVMGSAILRGRTTLVLDPFELAQTVISEQPSAAVETAPRDRVATILFAEDSKFFREHTTRLLEEAGYRVLAACDGQDAWEKLQRNGSEIQLVLTDIEMPRLDGLQFTRKIRADRNFARLPVVMLTSLAGDDDIQRGEAAGATCYCVKLDREQVLESLKRALAVTGDGAIHDLAALSRRIEEASAEPATCGPQQLGEYK